MSARFDLVTVDARDSMSLAAFWAEALGLHEVEREDAADGPGRWIVLGDADGMRRLGVQRIGVQRVGGFSGGAATLTGPQKPRWHLDVVCALGEIDAEVERLCGLGACVMRPVRHEEYGAIVALSDPEGNIFDVCAYS